MAGLNSLQGKRDLTSSVEKLIKLPILTLRSVFDGCIPSRMSTTSKSPRKVLLMAYRAARDVLPEYAHRFSPKTFTQQQLFACIVLKTFLKTDYRGVVEHLNDCPALCKAITLAKVPHYTTLQKASKRILRFKIVNELLESSVKVVCKNKKIKLAAVDSTGLQSRHTSRYFVHRKRSKQLETYENTYYRRFPKLAVVCDCRNHLVLAAITTRGPSVDVNQFERIISLTAARYEIKHLLADAGYDSEANHRLARETFNIKTMIPAKHGRPTTKPFRGKYRRLMQTNFNKTLYGQRWQVETVMSMIKRNQGDCLHARTYWARNREMMLKVLTHNIAIILLVNELFYRGDLTPLIP